MKIVCPSCGIEREIEHVDYGCNVECVCGKIFILDGTSVREEYTEIDSIIPAMIGAYKVTEFIGYGGMGKVYKAVHPALGIPVAIKAMRQAFSSDENACGRFLKSAKICARVNHPNIVRVYDCGYADGSLYLVMEYIPGGSVQDLIDNYSSIDPVRASEIVAGVCSGLAEAEQRGIVHRDVKPENIMFAADGTVKLLDLGLAKISGDKRINKGESTISFTALGTGHYMSPEQAVDAATADRRSDIYSLGVTFFQMVTGKYPYDAADPVELRKQHALSPIPAPSSVKKGIDPRLDYIIMKCMAKRRSDRYDCADALAADIDSFLAGDDLLPSRRGESLLSGVRDALCSISGKLLLLSILLLALSALLLAGVFFAFRR